MRTRRRVLVGPRLFVVLGLLGVGPGCSDPVEPPDPGPPPGPCGLAYLGNSSQPPSFTPTAIGPDDVSRTVEEGGSVSLHFPLQGGRVAFLGVGAATNLDPCGVTLLAAVRDPLSRQVRVESRTINLLPDTQGQGMSDELDLSTFANVPMCPNQWSSQDVFDHDYELTLTLTDSQQHSATRTLTIRPACDVPGQQQGCRCICRQGYVLGDACLAREQGP